MAKHRRPYQSPFAPLLTDQRFAFATQLAQQGGSIPVRSSLRTFN